MSLSRKTFNVTRQLATAVAGAVDLFETPIAFRNSEGETIKLKAVYQDTLPSGSSVGTVVALHGAPGSHLDYKYMRPLLEKKNIRFIGVNYPGFGVTPDHELLKFNNVERHDFVSILLDQLSLKDEKIVFIGHSRGTENAIMLGADREAHGIVLLNPTGLRIHRGIRPIEFLQFCNRVYNAPIPGIQRLLRPIFFQLYKYLTLKVADGKMAAHCMQTMENVALGEQKPFIDKINESKTKVLFFFAGKDWLIENEISTECAHAFDIDHFNLKTTSKEEAGEIFPKVAHSLSGKGCSVFFEKDGHFLQKVRADFICDAIEKMLVKPNSKL